MDFKSLTKIFCIMLIVINSSYKTFLKYIFCCLKWYKYPPNGVSLGTKWCIR